MTGVDPRAVAVLRAFRRRHALTQERDAAIWARLQRSIVDDTPAPEEHGDREARSSRVGRWSWLAAAAVVLGIVSASAIASSIATPTSARSKVMEALFELGRPAKEQPAILRAQPTAVVATPAEPPIAEPPIAEPPHHEATDAAAIDDSASRRPRRPSAPGRTATDPDALVVEFGMIRRARRALQEGDHKAALSLLDAHAHAFERGQMVEDRMTLRVQALCAARSEAAAKAEADRLSRRFPRSRRTFDPVNPCDLK